jgi:hypothetical protein
MPLVSTPQTDVPILLRLALRGRLIRREIVLEAPKVA